MKRIKGLIRRVREERGITGLETAIILIAFVVVAAVFSFVVLSTGLFSSERGKETVYAGLAKTRGSMELKALVVTTLRPDTLFIPFHYGHEQAVNQLTIPAVDPTVKIPEYKVCAAAIERLDAPAAGDGGATLNFTPDTAPAMFPYAVGETKRPQKTANLE